MFKLPIPTRLTDYLGEAVVWTVISITNVGLILMKPGGFSFLGVRTDGQTDTVLESSYGNMSAHKKISTQNSKLVVSRQSLYASPEDGDA